MRTDGSVFVAGATGVIGRRAVARLVSAGYQVTGVARSPAKAELLRAAGARPVRVDLFDAEAVREVVAGHDVIVNLATHIPPLSRAALPRAWAENDRIRREVSRNLVDAALATGASRYVQESIAFMYEDGGDAWLDEDTPVDLPELVGATLEAEAQAHRFTEQGGVGVVLRFGLFYAPDSAHTMETVKASRNGIALTMGAPDAYLSMVHADDAATAVVAALRAPAGTYNVTEDEPLPRRDHLAALASAVGRRRVLAVPGRAVRHQLLARSQRVSNRKFKEATGWAPDYPSVREGWPVVVGEMSDDVSWARGPLVRLALAALAVSGVIVGAWAQFAPRSFYDSFPGGGRSWVSADGPFNEHLVRDVGGLNLALAVLTIAALVVGGRVFVRTAAAAWLVYSVPHFAYHLAHLDLYGTVDRVMNLVSLALTVVVPALLLAGGRERTARAGRDRARYLASAKQ